MQRAGYTDAQYENLITNSHGLEAYYQGAYCGGYCLAIGEEKGIIKQALECNIP